MNKIKFFLVILILFWLFGFWYVFKTNSKSSRDDTSEYDEQQRHEDDSEIQSGDKLHRALFRRVKEAEENLKKLEERNKENELVIQSLKYEAKNYMEQLESRKNQPSINQVREQPNFNGPSQFHEDTRRKIFNDIKDLSYFVKNELNTIKENKEQVDKIKNSLSDRVSILLANMYNLSISDMDGKWRAQLAKELEIKVKKRFDELQNPSNCDQAKKILCDLNKACGFGCQVHHIMYCFITAFFTNRLMILESNNWRYNPQGFSAYFKPMSEKCIETKESAVGWGEHNEESRVIRMPIIDVITNKPNFLPLSVPKEYLDDLQRFHGDPFIWWAGQVLQYLMRFNQDFEAQISDARKKIGFKTPCVGVHVRRTDKVGTEAAFHAIDEYMPHVEEFFRSQDLVNNKQLKRVVYLATDDVQVIKDAKQRYANYEFIFDEANAKTASVDQRYSPESAKGVIEDIYFLSQCDYLVCTFSSQVCRLAYELMQPRFPDASWRFRSLDDVYYFGGQNGHKVMAIYDHEGNREAGEMDLKKGDLIGLAGNHWNGYSKGRNERTNQEGLFPSYKVKDVIQSV